MRRTSVSIVVCLALGGLLLPRSADASGSEVGFTSPAAGAAVRGVVAVAVTADPATTSVAFDRSTDGGSTWTPIGDDTDGSDGWGVSWDTTTGPEGPVVLRATAEVSGTPTVDAEDVTVDNTAPVVEVRVAGPAFSPNGDHRFDRARIRVALSEGASLHVRVMDRHGSTVATLASGLVAPAGVTRLSWNGLRGSRRVPDGTYSIVASATDAAGNRGPGSARIRVDTTPPRVRWISVRPDPASLAPVTTTFALRDAEGAARVSVALLGEAGLVRKVRVGVMRNGRRSVRIPVRDPRGVPVLPGLYRVRVIAVDAVANRRDSSDLAFRVEHPVRSRVWTDVDAAGRHVALTFDDCNDGAAWNRILSLLAANHVHTTFFCIGANVVRSPETARRTVALGDSVGDHTWDHASLPGMSETAVQAELRKQAEAWWKVARVTPLPYFRPPYGAYDATTLAAAGKLGFARTMLWDVDPQDWRRPGASVIASKVLGAIHPGAIVVMHVQAQTARALPSILAGLRRRGLLQSSLPELFAAAGIR